MSAPNLTEAGIYGAKPPGAKRLAKTAHMHEFKRDSRPGSRRGSVNSGPVDLSSDLDASLGLLTPMIEDPNTPGYRGILPTSAAKMQFMSDEVNKPSEAAKTPAMDIPVARPAQKRISSQSGLETGIPFPSPLPDAGSGNEDDGPWVDEDEDDEQDNNIKHGILSSNSYSPSSSSRGRRRFFSPKRSFAFSSSPPFSSKGKTVSHVKRNEGTAS